MSNTKALTPGTWCKPKDEKEWRAVLDLAKSLGLAVNDKGVTGYTICPMVWSIGYDGASRGLISMRTEPPGGNGSNLSDHPTPVPDFIAAMYALAEERKGETAKCGCPADDYISGPVHMQRLTQELRPVFASQGDMLRAFKRLTKLEQALNDHMVKEREKELAAYDRMTERYKEEQKAEEDEFRRLHPEATDLQVFLHIIDCGYGPRLYNPPLSARVKYIVVE